VGTNSKKKLGSTQEIVHNTKQKYLKCQDSKNFKIQNFARAPAPVLLGCWFWLVLPAPQNDELDLELANTVVGGTSTCILSKFKQNNRNNNCSRRREDGGQNNDAIPRLSRDFTRDSRRSWRVLLLLLFG
jgi:hypothetical protein